MYLSDFEAQDFNLIRSLAEQAISRPVHHINRLPGTSAYNYEINHRHIFKIPNEYTHQESWLRHAQLAPVLQKHFSFQIPHPQLKTLHMPDKVSTILSSSYDKIEGLEPLSDSEFVVKDGSFKTRFFEQLSDAAAQIHAVPLSDLPFQIPTKIDYFENEMFKKAKGDTYYPKKLLRKLLHNPFLGLGKSGLKTSLLAHTDLHSRNVLLNDKNELVAILDFDDMVCGDRFLEFRPCLYPDLADMWLFQEIYQKRTGIKIDSNEVYQLEIAQKSLYWFYRLYQLYSLLPVPDRNKKMKQDFKQKLTTAKGTQKCI